MRLNTEVHDRKEDGLCCCGRDGSKQLVMDGSELKQMVDAVAGRSLCIFGAEADAAGASWNVMAVVVDAELKCRKWGRNDVGVDAVAVKALRCELMLIDLKKTMRRHLKFKRNTLEHLQALKQKLEEEASENLGMAMNLNCCVSHTK
ncbi:hypothetical protein C5167_023431 [Papaver somniferum]|uniref:Uncharacterized protein n=1 Tax=Papaver somniferum TaxID=3469 RepID=A0A4Y7JPS6_PAPSO|nr:hypothetical protein C5167_023431 [Papaver somniferum]